jgi:PAS domain S-box-containing protein
MTALAQCLLLPSLRSVTDFSPLCIAPETALSEVIALMAHRESKYIVVVYQKLPIGFLTASDVVKLLASSINFATTKIYDVSKTSIITVKQGELQDIASILSMLHSSGLPLLVVVNEEGEAVGVITHESVCQGMASERVMEVHDKEHKETQESLFRFRKAIESSSDAIGMCNVDGKAIYVNQAFIELFEYSLQELEAAGGPSVLYPNREICQEIFANVESGKSWRGEVKMLTSTGKVLDIDLRADAIKDNFGNIIGNLGIHTDITERKRTEEGLLLRDRAIAASNNGIMIADAEFVDYPIIYANPAFERITGYSPLEVMGKNCRFLQGFYKNQPGLNQLREALQEEKSCTVVLRNRRKNGVSFWNELSISPVFDAKGKCTHYIGIQTDITERKWAETSLSLSQARLQYLLSSSPAVIYSCQTSPGFPSTFISDNIVAMLGYEAREVTQDSKFWLEHIHPEDAPITQKMSQIILQQGYLTLEYRFLHKNGTYRWVYDQSKLVWDDAGKPVEIVGYRTDITERKQLEEDLKAALAKEKELNELKSRFVSMISHEFRTPLSTILSSAELLEHYRHKWTEEKQLTHLRRIETAVKHMNQMLDEVLLIGRVEVGRLEFKPTFLDLVEYCNYLVQEVLLNVNESHLIVFDSEHKTLPCYVDSKLLGHILHNLLLNAIKYSSIGTEIKLSLTSSSNHAVLKIEDKGIGIPEADIPHLFDSFHRGRNVGNIQGTGLGLAIVKKCVDIHQGEIFVKSQLGIGTKFSVILPLEAAESGEWE